MQRMNVVNLIFLLIGAVLLSIAHGPMTGVGLGLLAFAMMPYYHG